MTAAYRTVFCIIWIWIVVVIYMRLCAGIKQELLWINRVSGIVCPHDAIRTTQVRSLVRCGDLCSKEAGCLSFTYVNTEVPNCYMMNRDPGLLTNCYTAPAAKHFMKIEFVASCVDIGNYHAYMLSDRNTHTFRVVTDVTADIVSARADCEATGGSLAKINTIARLQFLQNALSNCQLEGIGYGFYIDGNYDDVNGMWTWNDGGIINMDSTFWGDGEPNINNTDQCIVLDKLLGWRFNDVLCSYQLNYICERY